MNLLNEREKNFRPFGDALSMNANQASQYWSESNGVETAKVNKNEVWIRNFGLQWPYFRSWKRQNTLLLAYFLSFLFSRLRVGQLLICVWAPCGLGVPSHLFIFNCLQEVISIMSKFILSLCECRNLGKINNLLIKMCFDGRFDKNSDIFMFHFSKNGKYLVHRDTE